MQPSASHLESGAHLVAPQEAHDRLAGTSPNAAFSSRTSAVAIFQSGPRDVSLHPSVLKRRLILFWASRTRTSSSPDDCFLSQVTGKISFLMKLMISRARPSSASSLPCSLAGVTAFGFFIVLAPSILRVTGMLDVSETDKEKYPSRYKRTAESVPPSMMNQNNNTCGIPWENVSFQCLGSRCGSSSLRICHTQELRGYICLQELRGYMYICLLAIAQGRHPNPHGTDISNSAT